MAEYGLGSIYNRPNPHDRTVKAAASMMGSSGLAAPGLAYIMGKEGVAAGQFDEQQAAEASKQQNAKMFFEQFTKLSADKKTEGIAVEMWNRDAEKMLGIPGKISAVTDAPEITGVQFVNDKGVWWGIDKRSTKVMVSDGGAWREASDEDKKRLQTKKDDGEPPKTRERKDGRNIITEEWDPATKSYKKISTSPMDKPEGDGSGTPKDYRQWDSDSRAYAMKRVFSNAPDKNAQLIAAMNADDPGAAMDALSRSMTPEQVRQYEAARDEFMATQVPTEIAAEHAKIKGRTSQLKSPGADGAQVPAQGGRPLDEATARQILQEAGGDPNKARELARAKGFTF